MHVERTFTVPRPVETVYDYLSDFTHTEAWDPGTISTSRTSGDGGVGTTYANKSSFMKREVSLTYETVEATRPSKLVFRGKDGKSTTATDTMTFTPASDGSATEIHYRADFVFSTLINAIAPFFIKPKMEKVADETVAQLEETLRKLPA